MATLATKYRPKTFDEVVEQHLTITIIKSMCESQSLPNRCFLFIGPAGCGKAQPLYSKVLTPNGFITMGEVQVGTEVITGSGAIAKVSAVYPQGVRSIYEITLQDRTKIRVSDEHLNVVYRYNQDKHCREDYCLTTLDLIKLHNKSRFKLRIDIPTINKFYDHNSSLPIDPYLLGALIGDGTLCTTGLKFSNNEPDVIAKVDSILRRDWNKMLKKVKGDNVDYAIVDIESHPRKYTYFYKGEELSSKELQSKLENEGYPKITCETFPKICEGTAIYYNKHYPELKDNISMIVDSEYKSWTERDPFRAALSDLGLLVKSVEKHIPKEYLLSSIEDRLSLLQGLYDTDGYTSKEGATCFGTSSPQLSEDFAFLVRSLGIRDTVSEFPSKYKNNGNYIYTETIHYNHHIKVHNDMQICTSIKHTSRMHNRQQPPMRNITSIKYIGEEECQCIMVDHPDHTYISDGFIPTHNTSSARLIANALNEGKGEPIEIDAASHGSTEEMRQLMAQASQYPIGMKYKIFIIDECHSISNTGWQVMLKTLEEQPAKSIFILCTTNPEKIPATILSRVQTFKLSKISTQGIYNRLKYVIEQENKEGQGITYDDEALDYIARLSNGGMRDSLTNLDRCLAYSKEITLLNVTKALDLPDYDSYFSLLNYLVKHDNENITKVIHEVYNSGTNFIKWFEGFYSFLCNIIKYIYLKDINATMIPGQYSQKLSNYTAAHAVICLKLSNIVLQLTKDLKVTQYQAETAMTYLLTPKK